MPHDTASAPWLLTTDSAMEMMVSDGTPDLYNLRTAVPAAACPDSAAAAPLHGDLLSSSALALKEDMVEPLQFNIFGRDSKNFDIISEDGDIEYKLRKGKTFSPFSTAHWQLTDGRMDSPGTILIKRSPFAAHVSFERRDGSLIADMGQRMLMTGSEFTWGAKVYRWQMSPLSVPLKMQLVQMGTREEMAHLQGSWVWPWSVKQDNITITGPLRDPTWTRIVIASGMAEASRLSRRRTNNSAKTSGKAKSSGSVCGLISVIA